MKSTKSANKMCKSLNPLIVSNILYLNWLAEQRKETQRKLKGESNAKK